MVTKNEAVVVFNDSTLATIKNLLDLHPFPIVVMDTAVNIIGILDELSFWKSVCLNGWESSVLSAVNRNVKVYTVMETIENEILIEHDYFIFQTENVFRVYNTYEIIELQNQNRIDQMLRLNQSFREELEISQNENRELKQILDRSYDEIFVTDGEGNTLFVSESCKKFTGFPPEVFLGKNVHELMEKGIITNSVTLKVMETKKIASSKQSYPNGRAMIATATPVFNESGELTRIITNSRDVTELTELKSRLAEVRNNDLLGHFNQISKAATNFEKLVTVSEKMLPIIDLIERVAPTDSSVLIEGESGVGKGVLASIIHEISPRKSKKFITVNCGAIPATLIESELFGYEGGSFTGANKQGKVGLVEEADGGTLFLDEIGELPLDLQVKLLHLVQQKSFKRVGGTVEKNVDIRIVSATNRDLKKMITEKLFREDLYYRLHVVPILLPSLRERRRDIPILLEHFLSIFNKKYAKSLQLSEGAMMILQSYEWPGNIRELENLVEQMVITSKKSMIYANDLPPYITQDGLKEFEVVEQKTNVSLKEAVEETERRLLTHALQKHKTSRKIAKALGVNQTTIIRKLHKYNLKANDDEGIYFINM